MLPHRTSYPTITSNFDGSLHGSSTWHKRNPRMPIGSLVTQNPHGLLILKRLALRCTVCTAAGRTQRINTRHPNLSSSTTYPDNANKTSARRQVNSSPHADQRAHLMQHSVESFRSSHHLQPFIDVHVIRPLAAEIPPQDMLIGCGMHRATSCGGGQEVLSGKH